jgi:ubiquinone/menaquinone biosynthesis C-methylase UbiE
MQRSQYKEVWSELSATLASAKIHVAGSDDESVLAVLAAGTSSWLMKAVGISPSDVVLEIGCGIGRVGQVVAPCCQRWIGCDVSPNMLRFAADRLRQFSNVELVEISGHDLAPIANESVNVVYCTVVFMHLAQWDRYAYVKEAFRVLRPNGRIVVDNVNLCSDEGWAVFEAHRAIRPEKRPPHITECSTAAELEEYLKRAGFREMETFLEGTWVRVRAKKMRGAES